MSVVHNRKNLSFVVHATANLSLTIAGNSSVSNVAVTDEVLVGAAIKQVWWGSEAGAGTWFVKRGSNTVGVYDSTGWHDYAGNGCMLNKDSSATLELELAGTANGFIMIELQKIGTLPSNY